MGAGTGNRAHQSAFGVENTCRRSSVVLRSSTIARLAMYWTTICDSKAAAECGDPPVNKDNGSNRGFFDARQAEAEFGDKLIRGNQEVIGASDGDR